MKIKIFPVFSIILAASLLLVAFGGVSALPARADTLDGVVVVTDQNREQIYATPVGPDTDETYSPASRRWVGVPVVAATQKRLWMVYSVGGTNEPHADNYAAIAYSEDWGETWVQQFILINNVGMEYSPELWVDDLGRLWCLWNLNGVHAMFIENPDGPIENVRVSEPRIIMPYNLSSVPVLLSDGTYGACLESQLNFRQEARFYVSEDKGVTWKYRGCCVSSSNKKNWHEGRVVELSDGTLFWVTRLDAENGYEQSWSYDGGYTWTPNRVDTQFPYISCGSKYFQFTLKSGALFFVHSASKASRTNITAYLSYDDGKTWSDGLLLDGGGLAEYPAACQLPNGEIFVVWGHGDAFRNRLECRGARLTEEDVKNAAFTTSKTLLLCARAEAVCKWRDVVQCSLPAAVEADAGESFEEICARLPATVTLKDEDGKSYRYPATYQCRPYDGKEGEYKITVKLTGMDENLQDVRNLISVKLVVSEADAPTLGMGGRIAVGVSCGLVLAGAVILTAAIIASKRREKK